MKTLSVTALIAPTAVLAQWWRGAPECAQSCLSSAWSTASAGSTSTITSFWPAQSEYCDANKGDSVSSCIDAACSATAAAFSSYRSLSSSLCSRFAACTSAGSTGVQTLTYAGGPVTWAAPGGWGAGSGGRGPGNGFGGGPGGPGKFDNGGWAGLNDTYLSEWASLYSSSSTWSGGVVTVTGGCDAFDGSPWFVGPNCGWNGQGGFNGWLGWGSGWSWGPTSTQTVTITTTDSAGQQTTQTGLATVALAVSGDLTTSTTLGAAVATETGQPGENAATRVGGGPDGAGGSASIAVMGIALGGVMAIAGML